MRVALAGAKACRQAAALVEEHEFVRVVPNPYSDETAAFDPQLLAERLAGCEAVVHAPAGAPEGCFDAGDHLVRLTRHAYALVDGAHRAGVRRFVLLSSLDVFAQTPAGWRVDETWRPAPAPTGEGLAAFLVELTVREFIRSTAMKGVCLRLPKLGSGPVDPRWARALAMPLDDYHHPWLIVHLGDSPRFPAVAALAPPFAAVQEAPEWAR